MTHGGNDWSDYRETTDDMSHGALSVAIAVLW
jgi:hypothetical protein